MSNSKNQRKLWLAALVMGLLTVAGCNQQATQETNQTPNQASATVQKPPAARPAAVEKAPKAKLTVASAKVTQAPQVIIVPKNTAITATVDETLTSEKNHAGDTFSARLSAPVMVDGKVVLAKGEPITGRIVKVKGDELKVALSSIEVQGKPYDLKTNSLRPQDKNQGKDAAKLKTVSHSTKDTAKIDNSILRDHTKLTFKLAKPVTLSMKG